MKKLPRGYNLLDEVVSLLAYGYDCNLAPEVLAGKVLEVFEQAHAKCRDRDCVRRRSHTYLGPHLWKHPVQPPVTHAWFQQFCFTCGKRARHRIHTGRG